MNYAEEYEARLSIRKQIQSSGHDLYESIQFDELRYLVGEIMALNEDWVLTHPGTIGADEVLSTGFTSTQKTLIKSILDHIDYSKKVPGIVSELIENLEDRKGLRQEWEQIDDEVKQEIRDSWGGIISGKLEG